VAAGQQKEPKHAALQPADEGGSAASGSPATPDATAHLQQLSLKPGQGPLDEIVYAFVQAIMRSQVRVIHQDHGMLSARVEAEMNHVWRESVSSSPALHSCSQYVHDLMT